MLDHDTERWVFTITDLKQFAYCPRVFFYHVCLPKVRPVTAKMGVGIRTHADQRAKAQRRSLKMYDLIDGERLFDVVCASSSLGLTGIIDEVVVQDGVYSPVDYKLSRHLGPHFKLQLAAYALLLEETLKTTIHQGYLYAVPEKRVEIVKITAGWRRKVASALHEMQHIASKEQMPPSAKNHRQCLDCEFRRFCNDV